VDDVDGDVSVSWWTNASVWGLVSDPLVGAHLPVPDEDVGRAVGVAGHQVGGVGREGDDAPVGADGGPVTRAP
jgi:hypothetical protein